MRKLLISLLVFPALSFATELDMGNLKCGKLQIYASTTLEDIQNNCLLYRQFANDRNDKYPGTYQVEFYSTSYPDLVRCDFNSNDPKALVTGCR